MALFALLLCLIPPLTLAGAESTASPVFEAPDLAFAPHPIDQAVLPVLKAQGIEPSPPCSDAVFIRRVHLDLIGTLPDAKEVQAFLASTQPDKRAVLVDSLLEREEFAEFWTMRWGDALRLKAEYPINLWPNATQAYHRWIRDALRENRPLDQFARELLTASGSNFRVPPANFFRAVQGREPSSFAAATALTFLNSRTETWPAERRKGFEAFFTRIRFKATDEWKEEIVGNDPAPSAPLDAVFPDGTKVTIPPSSDPRAVLADWLLQPGNMYFPRAMANRVWAWVYGRGVVHEPDDIRDDNPPSNPALLNVLAQELVRSQYDLKTLLRFITTSRTYQQSPLPHSTHPQAAALFAYYPIRRLDAEVLIDALNQISGTRESYTSLIPEPYSIIPDTHRAIGLPDASVTSPFLELFARSNRDTGRFSERANEPSDAQRLHMLNSSHIQRKIVRGQGVQRLIDSRKQDLPGLVREIYLLFLARPPSEAEKELALAAMNTPSGNYRNGAEDLAWALVNTKEFLFQH